MTGEAIVEALGKPFEHAKVQALIRELGVTKTPRAKADDPEAGVDAKKFGVALRFIDADYLAGKKITRYGNADMILYTAILYTLNGEPGYKAFQGTVPQGISLGDGTNQLIAKLGPPTQVVEHEGEINTMSWQFDSFWLSFNFGKGGRLKYVGVMLRTYIELMDSMV
jgi:hypothetical protein